MNGILLNVVLMIRKFYKHDKIIDVVLINYYNCNLIIWDELIIYNNKLI